MPLFWVLMFILALVLLTRWTDKKGWTRFRQADSGKAVETAVTTFDNFLFPSHKAALEYQMEEHAEVEEGGEDKDPIRARAEKALRQRREPNRDDASPSEVPDEDPDC